MLAWPDMDGVLARPERDETSPLRVDSHSPRPWPAIGSRPLLGANGTEAMVARILRFVQLTGTPWTSAHIGFSVADLSLNTAESLSTQATSDVLTRGQALGNIACNARALAQRLPVPLLLENLPSFPNLAHIHICEPDFITEVIKDTGCGLLVDLAHARVSADMLGHDVHDYLLQLPLDRAVELHVSGPRRVSETDARRRARLLNEARSVAHLFRFGDDSLLDAHEPMQEEDYALLQWALERIRPKAVTSEFYREPEALGDELIQLGQILGR